MAAFTYAAINAQGLVAGTSIAKASGEAAFRYNPYTPAPMEDIGQSSRGFVSRGFGINNTGTAVGDAAFIASHTADSPIRHAALFNNGWLIDLGTLKKQTYSRANSINSFNQVVGFSGPALDTAKSRAFFTGDTFGLSYREFDYDGRLRLWANGLAFSRNDIRTGVPGSSKYSRKELTR